MKPTFVINPRSDDFFVRRVEQIAGAGPLTPDQLAERLRDTFPNVVVRRRNLTGEATEAWYVYREGRWIHDASETRSTISGPPATIWSATPSDSKESND